MSKFRREFESEFADLCAKHRVFVAAIYCTSDGESGTVSNVPDDAIAQDLFADMAAEVMAVRKPQSTLQ